MSSWLGSIVLFAVLFAVLIVGVPAASAQPAARLSPPTDHSGRPELLPDPTTLTPTSGRPTVLPDSIPEPKSPAQIILNAEYKFWRPRQQGGDFAIADPNADATPEGAVQSLFNSPSSGFRAAVGYSPGGSPWTITFGYTFYRNLDSVAIVAPAAGLLFTTLTLPGLITTADTASASTRWTHDLYDLELGRNLTIDPTLGLRVQVGARLADIGRESLVIYDGRDAALARVASGFQFTGAGLLFGGETHWTYGRGLSFFGRARGGMLIGVNRSYLRETQNDGAVVLADVTNRMPQSVPLVELGLGASFRFRGFTIRGGYEVTNWFQLITTPDLGDDISVGKLNPRQSNFSLDGFFVQVGYSF